MYNRYVPQPDGTYQKNRVPDSVQPPPGYRPQPVCDPAPEPAKEACQDPPQTATAHMPPSKHSDATDFLRRLLPKDLDTGDLLIIGASCFAAIGYLISKAMPKSCDALTATAWQQFVGGVLLLITGFCTGGKLSTATLPGMTCLIFLILAAAISYSLWFWLLQHNDVGRISISKFLTPLFGVLFSGILLQEDIFTPENGIALFLVCCGVIVVNTHRRA